MLSFLLIKYVPCSSNTDYLIASCDILGVAPPSGIFVLPIAMACLFQARDKMPYFQP